MTREDAIQALKDLRDIRLQGVEWTDALDMAISALKAIPCEEREKGECPFYGSPTLFDEDDYWHGRVPQGGDLISRADAVNAVHKYFVDLFNDEPYETDEDGDEVFTDMKSVNALLKHNKEVSKAIKALPSADAVPQLKQTDTLIIADALRYLAQDTERHLTDRTRADALRQQFLKYGASMCSDRPNWKWSGAKMKGAEHEID